ncbi:carboxylesterase family protein [Streptomyces sp. NBC_01275]|uniref:carboxylesterase/lipase family protein n=1 Tax=Streptomyces sp. NBC_01275 TaxID=2903807 RepID=UPI0022567821|nr:carboxylesterase family protein [Streptomyces sp. NBC_01275]MCX4765154.1 carboxylesterase family protein [Streptomyces sp. NBC_01275]
MIQVATAAGRLVGRFAGESVGEGAGEPAGESVKEGPGDVAVFRGVPFAEPPVGELRWRPPRPAAAWDGERPAYDFGPAPLQPQPPRDSIMFHTNFADRRALVMSEDCLYLNVWSPDPGPGAGLPVLVWIHGGGNRYGHGGQEIHDGRALARRGLVVVTLNHRLGALGFLAHPELAAEDDLGASGDYGLLDVVAALTWVRENIARFGGDPDRVTLAGNSAGAAHVCHLMASPLARPLFRAALGQSASGVGRAEGPLPDQAAAQRQGLRWAAEFGGRDLAGLRRLSGVELVLKGHFGPVVDGRVLPESTDDVFAAGRQHPVPLLVGANDDEGSVYATLDVLRRLPVGPGADALYPVHDGAELRRTARRFTGESRFVHPVWHWARAHRAAAPTWMYRFTRTPPLPADLDLAPPRDGLPGYGAHHTAELPYALDTLDRRPWPWKDADRALARLMADAWARFVETGDPNGGALPVWPRFTDREAMVFGEGGAAPGEVARLDALRFLARLPRPLH